MKPRNIVILVIILVPAATWTMMHYRDAQRRKLRETQYQSALKAYSSELKWGITRQDVEDLLRQRNINPAREPYGGPPLDDFINIGREQDLWYCSWENVDLQLQFTASKPDSIAPTPDDLLRNIVVSRWPHDCL